MTDESKKRKRDMLASTRKYEPLIPRSVVDYHLKKAGCIASDPDLLRLVTLATQKFAYDLVIAAKARAVGRQNRSEDSQGAKKKLKLVTRDVEATLGEYGIQSDVPPFIIH